MKLTQQQIDEMLKRGLTQDQISTVAQQKGYELPSGGGDLLKTASDAVSSVFAGKQTGQAIGTLAGYGIEKVKGLLGGQDNSQFYDLSAPSPLQVAGDVAKGAVQVAGAKLPIASSIPGKVAQFGGLGAASGASSAIAEGKGAEDVAKQTIKEGAIGALTGLTFGVVEKGAKALTNSLAKGGEKIQYAVVKPTAADIKDGFDIKTINKYQLGGSLKQTSEKTASKMNELSTQLRTKLASSNASIDLNTTFDDTVKSILGNKLESFGTNAQMDGAIEKLRNEILAVSGQNGLVSIPEAQTIKQASGHYGAWSFGNNDPEAKASEKVYNAFYSHMKQAIEKNSPEGVREINHQLSELIPVMNAIIRRIPVAERNGAISLTDIISMTAATVNPGALAITLANRASKSGNVGAFLAKQGNLGQGALKATEKVAQSLTSY